MKHHMVVAIIIVSSIACVCLVGIVGLVCFKLRKRRRDGYMLVNGEDGDAGAHFGFGGGNSDDGGGSAKSIDSSVYEKLDEWKISYDQLENMSRPFGNCAAADSS